MTIWYILHWFGTFCIDLVHFALIWYILHWFGTFCIDLVHFALIWYILHWFGTFFQFLGSFTKKNLATLRVSATLYVRTSFPPFLPQTSAAFSSRPIKMQIAKFIIGGRKLKNWRLAPFGRDADGATLFRRHTNHRLQKCRHYTPILHVHRYVLLELT
jgi:hypothetical protein